jgi:alpha-1,6-mannosyltransferase
MAIKTLHLTNAWHQTSGGIATFYRALMQEANRRGHEFRLVVPSELDSIEEVGSYARIYHVAAPVAPLNRFYRTIYPNQYLFKGSKLQKILVSERPDLIEIADKYTLAYLGGLLRLRLLPALDFRPVVVGLSSERMDDNFRSYLGRIPFGRQFCRWYTHWIYFPFFDHHIANSHYTADELKKASNGHMVARGTWVRPMGVDLGELSPDRRSDPGRQRLLALCGAPQDAAVLLYVGRLAPEKNLSLLFELAECLNRTSSRTCHFIVAGDGIERPRWEQYAAARLAGLVSFLGHVRDRNMLAMLYANADVFVHPNPNEPFGIAPLEAMASGVPVVAPDSGGVTSYANSGNAWTVPPTVEHFAAAVDEILNKRTLVLEKTAKALAIVESFRWDKVSASFLDLYQELHRTFHGSPISLPPDFYSTPAQPSTAWMPRLAAHLAQKMFGMVARTGASGSSQTPKLPGSVAN